MIDSCIGADPGGATGLGKSMGKRFLELGASLCICGRREQVLEEAAADLKRFL